MTEPRHPFRVDSTRRLAAADPDRHIADLVRLVLLTGPAERLHHPDFGAGLGATALFEPPDDALLAMIEVRALGSLEQQLGDRLEVLAVDVRRNDAAIEAEVRYRLRPAGQQQSTLVTT